MSTVVVIVILTVLSTSHGYAATKMRRLLVLIDASTSMQTVISTSPVMRTRFDAAKDAATQTIDTYAGDVSARDPLTVSVYTFTGDDAAPVNHTNGWTDSTTAERAIKCLVSSPPAECAALPDGGAPFIDDGNTPLALAMCKSTDVLADAQYANDTKILAISSDGEENTSYSSPCAGGGGTYNQMTGWSPGSWQANTVAYLTGKHIVVGISLFELPGTPPPVAPVATGLTSLEQFFTTVAEVSGGSLHIIHDDDPLPVIGDFDDDRCVSHNDAIIVARAFGPVTPPSLDGEFDLTADRVVGFDDYTRDRALDTGQCAPDPYVVKAPVVCRGAERIVIDGKAIEAGGTTIDVRGACEIVIKNSLIVSGQNAISISGAALIKIDHSIIVGQGAVVASHGIAILSASNSIFHGRRTISNAFAYVDRGGNLWETP